MKKLIYTAASCLLLLLSFQAFDAKASHAAGGELIYQWISDSTYRFYFKFYRDCTGIPEPPSVPMCYYNTCTNQTAQVTLNKLSTLPSGFPNGSPVATGCANQPSTCNGGSVPGYREWWYSADLTLPFKCNYWRFGVSINARNNSENIVAGTFYVESTLNNSVGNGNSSPVFSVKPVPYVCLNQFYKYNNGGVDPDGDSVAFQVIQPHNSNTCSGNPPLAPFKSGSPVYSIPTNPFQTNNSFTISATTGEMAFTPSLQGAHTVTVKATEYRNGVQIGSVMRDIQVQVINCMGSGVTPTLNTDSASVTGSGIYSNGNITACATKTFTFCFDIKSTDTAAKLVVTDNSGVAMPGSAISYSNLQTDSVRGCVTWTPSPIDTGNRVFVVTVKDSSCSSTGVAISHSITVPVYVWAVTKALKDTAICSGDSTILIGLGGTAYTWSVVPGGSPITSLSCTNCKSPVAKPTVTTSYIVNSNSAAICNQNTDTVTVTVIQQGVTATSNSPVCPGDTLRLFAGASGVYYNWTGPNGFTSTEKNPKIPNASSANAGFYGLSINNGTCASQVFNLQVLVQTPAGPNASSNSPVCSGSQLILTATTVAGSTVTYHWTGPNSFTSNQQVPVINNATTAHSGKYYVYATKDGCVTTMDSVTVSVTAVPPNPVVSPDTSGFCQSYPATALTATGTNLLWYTTPTGGTGTATLTPSTTVPGVFKYYVSQTVGICESGRDTATVIITAKPSPPTATTSVQYCQGATAVPLTATGTNIKWYAVPTGGSPLTSQPTPSTATPGNTIYFVSQTNATTGCESDRIPITVTVYPTPAPPAVVSPVMYCVGGPATPTLGSQVTGTNIKWYTTPTGGTGSATAPTVNTSVPTNDTYYVSQTLNTCEGTRGMIIVSVLANPAPPVTNSIAYCQFATAVPLTATGQNLLWYAAATGGTGKTAAPTPATNVAGTFTFYVSQTVNGCESERDSVVVTVHPKPQLPMGNDDSVCQYSTPKALTGTGTNLLWYTSATGGIGMSIPPSQATDTPGTYTWYVSQTINGCESDRDTVTIEVVKQPDAPKADSVEYCIGGIAQQLTAVGTDLKWYYVPTGGIATTIAPTPNTSVLGITHYYVSQTLNGCESPRDTLTVKVDSLVKVRIAFSDRFFCVTDSTEVTQAGFMPDTSMFIWSWDNGTVISGDSSGPYIVKWNTPGTKTITLNAENNGCKASDTNTVEVLPLPNANFNMQDEICPEGEVVIKLEEPAKPTYGYFWQLGIDDTKIIEESNNGFIVSFSKTGTRIVRLRVLSDSGCISPEFADTINVRETPKANILPVENSTVCTKTEIKLNATPLQGGLYKYKWSPAEYFMTNDASEVTAWVPSSGYLSLKITDEFGCVGMDSTYVGVKLCCKAILPSAFSPNNDGRNDKFGIISSGNYKISAFRIVNRYGREVFSTNNQQERWDGTYNGEAQGIGTYYYYIKYSCEDDDADNEVEERGDVTLIR